MDNLAIIDDALKALFPPAQEQKPKTMRICVYPVTGGECIIQFTVSAPEDEIKKINEVRVAGITYKKGTPLRMYFMALCNTIHPIMQAFSHIWEKEDALQHEYFDASEDLYGNKKYQVHYFTLEYPSL